MIQTIVVSGGNVNKEFISQYFIKNNVNYIVAVDKGLEILDELNILPTHIIGDFDSINKKVLDRYIDKNISIHALNPEKDYTDTNMALELAINLKSNDITILGAIGSRIDHTLSNIYITKEALEQNISCKLIDENNEISLINKNTTLQKDAKYKYISLLPLTEEAIGVSLEGFKYLLNNRTLKIGESISVSNEQIESNAKILIGKGILILMKSKD